MNNTNKYWYPVKVKNYKEYFVFSKLLKNGLKAYMPLIRYSIKKNERTIWKVKPIFKGIIFIYCQQEDLSEIQKWDTNIKVFCCNKEPAFIHDHHICFIKKVFTFNEFKEVIPKELYGQPHYQSETEEFGQISLMKSYYKENEVITWLVPVIKNTLIFNKNSTFLKYLIFESQDSMV